MRIKGAYIICFVFLLLGCEEPIVVESICKNSVSAEYVKSYFDFAVGTKWVYQEEVSGELDTLIVFYHTPRFESNPVDFYWLASSSRRGYNYYQNYFENDHGITQYSVDGCLRHLVYGGYEKPAGYSLRKKAFFIGITRSEVVQFDSTFFIEERDTMNIGGIDYHDVLIYINDNDICFDYDSIEYSVASHYGIVRFVNLTNGEHWNLVSSEIIK